MKQKLILMMALFVLSPMIAKAANCVVDDSAGKAKLTPSLWDAGDLTYSDNDLEISIANPNGPSPSIRIVGPGVRTQEFVDGTPSDGHPLKASLVYPSGDTYRSVEIICRDK